MLPYQQMRTLLYNDKHVINCDKYVTTDLPIPIVQYFKNTNSIYKKILKF